MNITSILEAEGIEILKHVDLNAYVILWDRKGQKIDSLGLAGLLPVSYTHLRAHET